MLFVQCTEWPLGGIPLSCCTQSLFHTDPACFQQLGSHGNPSQSIPLLYLHSPLSLSQAALVSFHSQTLPYINTQQYCALCWLLLRRIYVSLCLWMWMCVLVSLVGGQSKFGLKEAVCFRMPLSSRPKGPVCSAYK